MQSSRLSTSIILTLGCHSNLDIYLHVSINLFLSGGRNPKNKGDRNASLSPLPVRSAILFDYLIASFSHKLTRFRCLHFCGRVSDSLLFLSKVQSGRRSTINVEQY